MNKLHLRSNFIHLDAVQGNSEARTKLYANVLRGSTGAVNEVMRQKSTGCLAKPGSSVDGGGI